MSFPKRGTRRLVVEGLTYHWHMSPKDLEGVPLATVRAVDGGPLLHYWPPYGVPSPAEAAAVIRFAVSAGWPSRKPGSAWWVGHEGEGYVLSDSRQPPLPWS